MIMSFFDSQGLDLPSLDPPSLDQTCNLDSHCFDSPTMFRLNPIAQNSIWFTEETVAEQQTCGLGWTRLVYG
jgi:hypothetical protein